MTHARSSGWRPVIPVELVTQRANQSSRQNGVEEWSTLPKYEWHLIELTASVHASQRNAEKRLHGHDSAEKCACGALAASPR